jgi:hypothetical protein
MYVQFLFCRTTNYWTRDEHDPPTSKTGIKLLSIQEKLEVLNLIVPTSNGPSKNTDEVFGIVVSTWSLRHSAQSVSEKKTRKRFKNGEM